MSEFLSKEMKAICNEYKKQGALKEAKDILKILETWKTVNQVNPVIIDLIKDRIKYKELEEGVEK